MENTEDTPKIENQFDSYYNQNDITSRINKYKNSKFIDQTFNALLSQNNQEQYIDRQFPPEMDSLGHKVLKRPKLKKTTWKKASDFIEKDKLSVYDENEPQKVIQGRIGDCYLMNPVTIMSLNGQQYVDRLFTIKNANTMGYYSVWLQIDGVWTYISVDEYFPWRKENQTPQFCQNNGNQIWPMVIEKAWAKLHTGYQYLWGGHTGMAFRVITGAPVDSYTIMKKYKKDPRNKRDLYRVIQDSIKQKYLIALSTGELNEHYQKKWTQGHSYALHDIDIENNKITIRDPRGEYSPFKIEFYDISFDELIYLFTCMFVCKIKKKYLFSEYTLKASKNVPDQNFSSDLVRIHGDCIADSIFTLSIFQSNKRFFKKNYKYSDYKLSKIVLKFYAVEFEEQQEENQPFCQYNNNIKSVKILGQKSGAFKVKDLYYNPGNLKQKLRGKYQFYLHVQGFWESDYHRQLNFSCYGQKFVEFEDLSEQKGKNKDKLIENINNCLEEQKRQKKIKKKDRKSTQLQRKSKKIKVIQKNIEIIDKQSEESEDSDDEEEEEDLDKKGDMEGKLLQIKSDSDTENESSDSEDESSEKIEKQTRKSINTKQKMLSNTQKKENNKNGVKNRESTSTTNNINNNNKQNQSQKEIKSTENKDQNNNIMQNNNKRNTINMAALNRLAQPKQIRPSVVQQRQAQEFVQPYVVVQNSQPEQNMTFQNQTENPNLVKTSFSNYQDQIQKRKQILLQQKQVSKLKNKGQQSQIFSNQSLESYNNLEEQQKSYKHQRLLLNNYNKMQRYERSQDHCNFELIQGNTFLPPLLSRKGTQQIGLNNRKFYSQQQPKSVFLNGQNLQKQRDFRNNN